MTASLYYKVFSNMKSLTKNNFLAYILSISLLFSIAITTVYAQTGGGGGGGTGGGGDAGETGGSLSIPIKIDNPFSGGDSLFALLSKILNDIIMPIGGVLAVLAFVYSGFLYVMAQGNEEKLKNAHRALLFTSIGTAVLLGAWVLSNAICKTIEALGGPECLSL